MLAGLTFFGSKGVTPWPRHMRFPVGGGLAAICRFLARSEGLGHFNRSKIEATALPLLLLGVAVRLGTTQTQRRGRHIGHVDYMDLSPNFPLHALRPTELRNFLRRAPIFPA